jgi:cyclophilin family peptidyl-prolyl cis-trans isomerase/HEAT repeat protein
LEVAFDPARVHDWSGVHIGAGHLPGTFLIIFIFREITFSMWKFALIFLLCTTSCAKKAPNKFSDPKLVEIYDLRDRRASDSLTRFIGSENPIYRREVALAFASVQDKVAAAYVGNMLLEDSDDEVRRHAAFSLGQVPGFEATNALLPALNNKNSEVLREVLESLGKTIEEEDFNALINFNAIDSLQQEGQARGFYQLALRRKADSTVTRKAADYLKPEFSRGTRLAAAHYFARSNKIEGKGFEQLLINAAQRDKIAEVRMAAASGLRHIQPDLYALSILMTVRSDPDYRVRINAVRACQNLQGMGFDKVNASREIIYAALNDSAEMVQVAASEVIRNLADKVINELADKKNLAERFPFSNATDNIKRTKSWRTKSNLYAAVLKPGPTTGGILDDMLAEYGQGPVYYRSALASALGEARAPLDRKAFEFLAGELLKGSNEKVILTSCASALVFMNRRESNKIPNGEFLKVYKQAFDQGDVAVIGIICSALGDEKLKYKEQIKDFKFLYDAKAKFRMPQDIESLQPLERVIAYFEGREKPKDLANVFNHPIPWDKVMAIDRDQRVQINTSKGAIVIRLLVEEAPGSVANFVDLISSKYFDGKNFHRVVPNFVIQDGCKRGDGYGSEDYSIRSEFSERRYTTGSVGMASAGKDTEGTQWFITHQPTPHLDGRYTIFAETISGLDVVNKIEVGDKILEVKLLE